MAKRNRHPINLSWEGDYESVLEDILTSGDLLFFANDNSTISWLVQYFTKTDISHVGIYIGDGKVFHATLSGSRIDHLSTFFGNGRHVVPVIMPSLIKKGSTLNQPDLSVGMPYPIKSVIFRGARYLIGIPWRKLRFTYVFDMIILLSIITAIAFGSDFVFPLAMLLVAYIISITFSFLNRDKINVPISDPGEGFYYLPSGAEVLPCVKKMNEKWFIDRLTRAVSREN
ncbi:C40 family peptidase [Shewanella baltica]|uniref:NlpC/P60 family protein n=1 Tax=Shewanella baltica TaxID=62322 RepID=UPI00217DF641|nr:NlpC/P60 family protein [Shewanella baltica]MCS6237515.1 C40 family peptidase [Shewanella baltica]MCS6272092.1 C40 family peptidase [Shewanella baltica]